MPDFDTEIWAALIAALTSIIVSAVTGLYVWRKDQRSRHREVISDIVRSELLKHFGENNLQERIRNIRELGESLDTRVTVLQDLVDRFDQTFDRRWREAARLTIQDLRLSGRNPYAISSETKMLTRDIIAAYHDDVQRFIVHVLPNELLGDADYRKEVLQAYARRTDQEYDPNSEATHLIEQLARDILVKTIGSIAETIPYLVSQGTGAARPLREMVRARLRNVADQEIVNLHSE